MLIQNDFNLDVPDLQTLSARNDFKSLKNYRRNTANPSFLPTRCLH
ncbi:MAG: hypothetical protein HC859_16010 [Bacteroidia bacterium]|nr:hypothetical protein [Bacteroidia bacterium]